MRYLIFLAEVYIRVCGYTSIFFC